MSSKILLPVGITLIGLAYSVLVYLGVNDCIDWMEARGIAEPWTTITRLVGFGASFLSLLYPMFFLSLFERMYVRRGPIFTKTSPTFTSPQDTSTDEAVRQQPETPRINEANKP